MLAAVGDSHPDHRAACPVAAVAATPADAAP